MFQARPGRSRWIVDFARLNLNNGADKMRSEAISNAEDSERVKANTSQRRACHAFAQHSALNQANATSFLWSLGRRNLLAIVTCIALCSPTSALQQPEKDLTTEQVAQMSLEELMGVQVTSVAGLEREWFTTPAAIDVITGDDIRRGGHRTLAHALRMAPGIFVGKINSQAFSVGMRGFNGSLANKTLVLIDGRAVYDPLFGGTFWNVQDVLLEDVDRVEVIRGPGPT
jgi:outer membrane receptor for ferric coprogen and ferric-rhodotorulic acid